MPNFMLRLALQALATAIPLFIIWIVGLVLAIIRWKKDPKKAIFTLLAILLIGLVLLLEIAWNIFGVRWVNTNPNVIRMARTLFIAIPLAINLLRAGSWVLILLAIFSRPKQKSEPAKESGEAPAEETEEQTPLDQDSQ